MSSHHAHCDHNHGHDRASHEIIARSDRERYEDPTHTRTVSDSYARRLRGAFSNINTVIREWVEEDDGLEITAAQAEITAEPPHPSRDYDFSTDEEKVEAFAEWLEEAQESEVLQVVDIDDNRYVRKTYEKGAKAANGDMADNGIDVEGITDLGNQPVHSDSLELLYARNYELLEGITEDVADEVREVMTEGFQEGVGPREMGRSIRDRVDKVGMHRATMLARTETIHAHTQGAVGRYRQILGDDAEVVVEAEILTAGDERVCPICEPRHGTTMSLDEAEQDGPPFHPQCRCTIRASFDQTAEATASASVPVTITPSGAVDKRDLYACSGCGDPVYIPGRTCEHCTRAADHAPQTTDLRSAAREGS